MHTYPCLNYYSAYSYNKTWDALAMDIQDGPRYFLTASPSINRTSQAAAVPDRKDIHGAQGFFEGDGRCGRWITDRNDECH
jgi:hypothetical protein